MNCPNCSRVITTKKYAIFTCACGRTLMLIVINKVKEIVDVTSDKEEK